MSKEQETRIQFGRTDLVKKFVEVQQAPEVLQKKFEHPPLKHLLSTYVIRPVACDTLPYYIHHRNKQTVILQQHEKNIKRASKDGEVDQFEEEIAAQEIQAEEESSDAELDEDGFEMVTTEKKRDKNVKAKEKKDFEPKKADLPEVAADPRFPASDPSKVKVIVVPQKPKTARKFEKREDAAPTDKKPEGEQKAQAAATDKPVVAASTVDYSSMMGATPGAGDDINQKASASTTEAAPAAKQEKEKKVEEPIVAAKAEPAPKSEPPK